MNSYINTDLNCFHAFSTRLGGFSDDNFESLNLSFRSEDNIENVLKNWNIFLSDVQINSYNIAWGKQVHSSDVKIVSKEDSGQPGKVGFVGEFDGLVTNEKDICLVIFTADCAPVILCDEKCQVVADLHCGWKPLTKDILYNGINAMSNLGSRIENISAAIGPCIQKCCFETDKDVYMAINNLLNDNSNDWYSYNKNTNKYHIDLSKAIYNRLIQLGMSKNNIYTVNECTCCNNDKYFSYRSDGQKTGRMANVVCL